MSARIRVLVAAAATLMGGAAAAGFLLLDDVRGAVVTAAFAAPALVVLVRAGLASTRGGERHSSPAAAPDPDEPADPQEVDPEEVAGRRAGAWRPETLEDLYPDPVVRRRIWWQITGFAAASTAVTGYLVLTAVTEQDARWIGWAILASLPALWAGFASWRQRDDRRLPRVRPFAAPPRRR